MRLRLLAILLLSATAAVPTILSAHAADSSTTTLEANLAPEVAADLIATYDKAVKAEPGFEPFQALFTRFETVRKWEAYLDAMKSTGLKIDGGPYAAIAAAQKTLAAHGITRASIATAAIEKLAGVGDWRAADQAQAELVIDELGTLLTEISDPVQRIRGQLVLAAVELKSDTPAAARIRVGTALDDLRRIADAAQQLNYGEQLADVIFQLRDPQAIEITSEIITSLSAAAGRARMTDSVAPKLAEIAADRLNAPGANDALALAWRYQLDRLGGKAPDLSAALTGTAIHIDPLPVAIVLAGGQTDAERRDACVSLVNQDIAAGYPLRAVNIRKMLPAGDCPAETALDLAAALTAGGMRSVALPPLADALTALDDGGLTLDDSRRAQLTTTLVSLASLSSIDEHATGLQQALGKADYLALRGRVAVASLLERGAQGGALPKDIAGAITAYAPTAMMAGLISGATRPSQPGNLKPVAEDEALFARIGEALAIRPAAQQRLTDFLGSDAPIAYRLALATGITSTPRFRLDPAAPLGTALTQLESVLGVTPHAELSAALGTLDPATIAADDPKRDALLLRLARAQAWSGDLDAATATAMLSSHPDPIHLAVAAITGIGDGFEDAAATIRAAASSHDRVTAFRLLASARADQLTGGNWLSAPAQGTGAGPVRLLRASATTSATTQVTRTSHLTVSLASAPQQAPSAPPIPSLDVDSADVISTAPYPVAGEGGVVVGGEGRFVRLARFESPSFDGQQNNGVRDYVYQQNATITPEFIFLNTGVFTLADMISAIGRADTGAVTLLPDGEVRINRPIAVGPDATLIISGAETPELQLNATLGSYLVNAGHLYIFNTRLVGYDTDVNGPAYVEKDQPADKFRPFILSWSGSQTNIADSELVALGYSAGRSYGLSLTSGPPDDFFVRAETPAPTGIIVNNSFDNSYYGFYAYEAEHVQVIGNEYRNSVIYGIDPHDRSRDLNLSLNTAYGTYKKHGIILSREVDDSTIVGNLTFDNHGSGIMLDRASTGTVIAGNTVRGNEGDGIAIFESPCTLIGANDITANGRSGVLVRNSWDVGISQNRIARNDSAGVQGFISDLTASKGSEGRNFDLDPYQPFTSLSISDNGITGNGAGIQTAGVSLAALYDNHFRDQSKRLFGGDLDGLSAVLLQNASKAPTLVSTNCTPVLTMPKACRLIQLGVLGSSAGSYRKGATGDYCLADAGSPQAQAFNGAAQ